MSSYVGSKLKLAFETGNNHTIGIDLVTQSILSVNDGNHNTGKLKDLGNMLTILDPEDSIVVIVIFNMLNLANL
ncbi:hypothetical protein Bca4012_066513 [Brassica carinata]